MSNQSEEQDTGDFVIILSSDLISKVMNQYFNDVMFMVPVEVVDLQASESGYAFTVSFRQEDNVRVMEDERYEIAKAERELQAVGHKRLNEMRETASSIATVFDAINDDMPKVVKGRGKGGRFVKHDQ